MYRVIDEIEFSRVLETASQGSITSILYKFYRAAEVLHAIAILSCGVRKGARQNFVVSVVYKNSAIAVVKKTFFFFILLSIHVQLDLAIILATALTPSVTPSYISRSISLIISSPRSIAIILAIALILSTSTKFSSFFPYSLRETFHSPSSLATSYFA